MAAVLGASIAFVMGAALGVQRCEADEPTDRLESWAANAVEIEKLEAEGRWWAYYIHERAELERVHGALWAIDAALVWRRQIELHGSKPWPWDVGHA